MERLKLNSEFLRRHLFALVVMFGLGGWFAYDGLVAYPQTEAAALYAMIEKVEPSEKVSREQLEAFKRQKIQSQYGFMGLCWLAALAIGLHLLAVSRFDCEYGEGGFVYRGKRYRYDEVVGIDDAQWKSKGVMKVKLSGGVTMVLDAWHFNGVESMRARFVNRADQFEIESIP